MNDGRGTESALPKKEQTYYDVYFSYHLRSPLSARSFIRRRILGARPSLVSGGLLQRAPYVLSFKRVRGPLSSRLRPPVWFFYRPVCRHAIRAYGVIGFTADLPGGDISPRLPGVLLSIPARKRRVIVLFGPRGCL